MDHDFVIIGAGLAGAATAYALRAQAAHPGARPPRVVILEKETRVRLHQMNLPKKREYSTEGL